MSDECTVEICIREQDMAIWESVSGDPRWWRSLLEGTTIGQRVVRIDEANYAWESELTEAASQGAVFVGQSGTGHNYGPTKFYGLGNKYDSWDTNGGELILRANPRTGKPSKFDVNALRKFHLGYNKAKREVKKG